MYKVRFLWGENMLVVLGVLGFLLLFLGYFMLAVLNYLDKVGYAEVEEQEHARAKP